MTKRHMGDVVPLARQLEMQLTEAGLSDFVREYRFHPVRLWRADLAFVDERLLIEVDGGQWRPGTGHNTGTGRERDCIKDNEALLAGWRVMRFTTSMVQDQSAVLYIRRALEKFGKRKGKT